MASVVESGTASDSCQDWSREVQIPPEALVKALDQLLNQAVHLGGVEAAACEGYPSAKEALGRTTQETQDMRIKLLNKLGVIDLPAWTPPE